MNSYKLERRSDKNTWVNIEPLMADIQTNYNNLHDLDTSSFTEQDHELLELKMVGLRAIYEFLGALKMEQILKERREELALEQLNSQINQGTNLMEKTLH